MTRRARIWAWSAAALVVFLLIGAVVSIQVLKSAWFANYVREKIISVTEESTGGKVELGAFSFNWRHLQATVENFVLHGTEGASDAPLFAARRIELRLTLLAGLKKAVELNYLGVDRPAANIIVFADGGTNVPEPKVKKKSDKSGLETVVDLAIGRFEISNGSAALSEKQLAFSGQGDGVQIQLFYREPTSTYQGDIKIAALKFTPDRGQPLVASVDLPVEIGKDRIDAKNAAITTHDSRATITASLSNMKQPVLDAHVMAHLSLAEIQRTGGVPMDACKGGLPCFGDADIETRLDQQSLQISKASIVMGKSTFEASGTRSNVDFNGTIAVDEVARLFRVGGDPRGSLSLSGSAKNLGTAGYSLTGNILGQDLGMRTGFPGLQTIALSSEVTADPNRMELHKLRVGIAGGEIVGDASLAGFSQLQFDGRLKNLTIHELERQMKLTGPGYSGSVNGELKIAADFKAPGTTGIKAQAHLSLAPGSPGVPVSGTIQASYDGARGAVNLAQSFLTLPHSRLQATGILGQKIAVDFLSTGLDDLYPALAMSMTDPPKEMPVAVHGGKVAMHADVTGMLTSPNIAAHVDADRFSVGQRPFDHLSADVAASPSGAAITNGALTHQSLQAQFTGSIALRQWAPENASPVKLALDMNHGDIADMLALAGESRIPARGSVDLSARIDGTLGNPLGNLHLVAANGALYDQPFDKTEGDVELTDQLIRVAAMNVTAQTAAFHIQGSYTHPRDTLLTGRVQVHADGAGIEASQIVALDQQHPGLSGSLQFAADAGGEVAQSQGQTEFTLSAIHADLEARGLRDPKQTYGDLTAHADTSGSTVNFNLASNLAGAATKLTGHTTLAKDYPTTAEASIANLHIENAIALTGETIPAKGIITVAAQVSGPIALLSGNAQVNLTAANLYGEPVNSAHAELRYSSRLIEIPALQIAAPAGNVAFHGSFSHPDHQFDAGKFELHASSDSIQLARIQNVLNRKPGIAGTLKFATDLSGDMTTVQGAREVSISKVESKIDATGIAYNGHIYGNAAVVAETKGNAVVFTADSNFAGAAIHGEGSTRLEGDYPLTAKLTLTNVRYSNLKDWFGDESLRPGFEALLEANGTVSGPAKKPADMKAVVQVTRFELSVPTPAGASAQAVVALKNEGTMALDYDHGSMRIQNAHLTGKSTDIAITGSAAFSGSPSLNLAVKASTELGLLQDISREIHASGAVSADFVVRGTFSQPLANGTVQLKDAAVNMESLPNGISKANGVIALTGSGANIRNLTAETGGGKLTLSGFATLTGSTVRYSLNVRAAHVRTRYQGVSVVNSGSLTLGGTSGKSLVSGTVTVERVAYNAQSDIGSLLSQLTGSAAPNLSGDTSGAAAAMHLDIHIVTSPGVRFETTMAQTLQADADLTLGGTMARPGMVGRINITQGDLIFFGNEYTVQRGQITFYDPSAIDPRISIDLETNVQSVTVTLGVTGPMNNLKLSYHSDPPLQFEEIVGLLTSGKRPSSDPNIVATQAASPQQSVAEMGETAIVSQAVASPLSSRLQRVFGVNQLRIDPTFSSGSALPQARLSLQQRVANSVTFTYTQDLSQSNSELVRVEWAVNPRFSVVATRDENGIFGVDVFYKKQFR